MSYISQQTHLHISLCYSKNGQCNSQAEISQKRKLPCVTIFNIWLDHRIDSVSFGYKQIIFMRQTTCFRPRVSYVLPKWCYGALKGHIYNTVMSPSFVRKHFVLSDSPQIKHINKINGAKRTMHWDNFSIVSENLYQLKSKASWMYTECVLVTFTLIYKTATIH